MIEAGMTDEKEEYGHYDIIGEGQKWIHPADDKTREEQFRKDYGEYKKVAYSTQIFSDITIYRAGKANWVWNETLQMHIPSCTKYKTIYEGTHIKDGHVRIM